MEGTAGGVSDSTCTAIAVVVRGTSSSQVQNVPLRHVSCRGVGGGGAQSNVIRVCSATVPKTNMDAPDRCVPALMSLFVCARKH